MAINPNLSRYNVTPVAALSVFSLSVTVISALSLYLICSESEMLFSVAGASVLALSVSAGSVFAFSCIWMYRRHKLQKDALEANKTYLQARNETSVTVLTQDRSLETVPVATSNTLAPSTSSPAITFASRPSATAASVPASTHTPSVEAPLTVVAPTTLTLSPLITASSDLSKEAQLALEIKNFIRAIEALVRALMIKDKGIITFSEEILLREAFTSLHSTFESRTSSDSSSSSSTARGRAGEPSYLEAFENLDMIPIPIPILGRIDIENIRAAATGVAPNMAFNKVNMLAIVSEYFLGIKEVARVCDPRYMNTILELEKEFKGIVESSSSDTEEILKNKLYDLVRKLPLPKTLKKWSWGLSVFSQTKISPVICQHLLKLWTRASEVGEKDRALSLMAEYRDITTSVKPLDVVSEYLGLEGSDRPSLDLALGSLSQRVLSAKDYQERRKAFVAKLPNSERLERDITLYERAGSIAEVFAKRMDFSEGCFDSNIVVLDRREKEFMALIQKINLCAGPLEYLEDLADIDKILLRASQPSQAVRIEKYKAELQTIIDAIPITNESDLRISLGKFVMTLPDVASFWGNPLNAKFLKDIAKGLPEEKVEDKKLVLFIETIIEDIKQKNSRGDLTKADNIDDVRALHPAFAGVMPRLVLRMTPQNFLNLIVEQMMPHMNRLMRNDSIKGIFTDSMRMVTWWQSLLVHPANPLNSSEPEKSVLGRSIFANMKAFDSTGTPIIGGRGRTKVRETVDKMNPGVFVKWWMLENSLVNHDFTKNKLALGAPPLLGAMFPTLFHLIRSDNPLRAHALPILTNIAGLQEKLREEVRKSKVDVVKVLQLLTGHCNTMATQISTAPAKK